MNSTELEVEMLRFGDSGEVLSKYLEITAPTFSNKKNGKSEFTQGEIKKIAIRYSLTPERTSEIFFAT